MAPSSSSAAEAGAWVGPPRMAWRAALALAFAVVTAHSVSANRDLLQFGCVLRTALAFAPPAAAASPTHAPLLACRRLLKQSLMQPTPAPDVVVLVRKQSLAAVIVPFVRTASRPSICPCLAPCLPLALHRRPAPPPLRLPPHSPVSCLS